MAKTGNLLDNPSGLFIAIFAVFALVSFAWYALYGYVNDNPAIIYLSLIMGTLAMIGLVFSNFSTQIIRNTSWGALSFSYMLGFLFISAVYYIPSRIFSVFQIPTQSLFSLITGEVPQFLQVFVETAGASTTEELIFTLGLTTIYYAITEVFVKKGSFLDNEILKFGILIALMSPLFAYFHVGMLSVSAFIISAIMFRVMLGSSVIGDWRANFIPFVTIYFPFAFSAHLFNNVYNIGLANWISVMLTHPIGISFLLLVGWVMLSGLIYAFQKIDVL